jgi:hypothetical protein
MNNIKLSIELGFAKLKERFLKKRKRITVLNSDYIQRLVVNVKL